MKVIIFHKVLGVSLFKMYKNKMLNSFILSEHFKNLKGLLNELLNRPSWTDIMIKHKT